MEPGGKHLTGLATGEGFNDDLSTGCVLKREEYDVCNTLLMRGIYEPDCCREDR